MDPSTPRPAARAERAAISGRRPADRRVRVAPRTSPYFRYTGPGTVTARPAASAPTQPIGRMAARRPPDPVRPPARERRGSRRAAVDPEGAGGLLQRQPVLGRLRDRGDHVHAARGRDRCVLADHPDLDRRSSPSSASSSSPTARRSAPTRTAAAATSSPRENLGQLAGLVAAAALLVDYVLTVSVSVAAGVAAITSAFPDLSPDIRVPVATVCILAVMLVNLRGIRESGTVFAIPTYVFLVSMLGLIAIGVARTLLGDTPQVEGVTAVVGARSSRSSLLLLMRAFADGCSAITGVEAVSNGVPAFKPTRGAQRAHDAHGHGRPRRAHVPRHVLAGRRDGRRPERRTRRSSRRSAGRCSAPGSPTTSSSSRRWAS